MGFELTTLVVIGTDCTDSCKSNYLTITAMTAFKFLNIEVKTTISWIDKVTYLCTVWDMGQVTEHWFRI